MSVSPDPAARLIDADREAALARQRLHDTLDTLQVRLSPGRLTERARREARIVGGTSADIARQNSGVLIGVGVVIGLLLARKPIGRLFRPSPRARTAARPAVLPPPPPPKALAPPSAFQPHPTHQEDSHHD
jgi:hypothetical protein